MKILLSCLMLLLSIQQVWANLLLTPSRISLDARERSEEIILINSSDKVQSYQLEWITQKQQQTGAYQLLAGEEAEQFPKAEPFIRFSPRRVTLQPGERQAVKLMVRRKNNMNEPEYRSHLKFTALPPQEAPRATDESEGMSLKLDILLSYSIPVILRTTDPEGKVSFENVGLDIDERGEQFVMFTINKPATTSVFGNFTVFHELNGVEREVGYLNRVNIFAETNIYKNTITLITPIPANEGIIRIEYKGIEEFADTELGEVSLAL